MSQAGIWTLNIAAAPESIATNEVKYSKDHGGLQTAESIIGSDRRVPVLEGDFKDNGRYRSVVKIQARFGDADKGNSVWMMGTGWLIQPDLLVTAGHVVYDWSRKLGEAREIRCYIGYHGRASIGNGNVQSRSGVKIVTTAEWLADTPERPRTKDLAFIQVDRPFAGNLQLFKYVNTPVSAEAANIGVVGYPGDKYLKDEERGTDEYGALMYEEFQYTDYDIAKSSRNMVEYKVSTYGGQSGAPIIRRGEKLVVIGTHCYGGGGFDANSGNSIGGKYGNAYENYIALFTRRVESKHGKATLVPLTGAAPIPSGSASNTGVVGRPAAGGHARVESVSALAKFNSSGFVQQPSGGRGPHGADTEGIFDILKTVGKAASVALPVAGSILGGPIGGGVATLAGSLLGYVSRAESALDSGASSAESFVPDRVAAGAAERAVLAEAALQTIASLEHSDVAEGLLTDVLANFKRTMPNLDDLVKAFRPVLTKHAMNMTMHGMNRTAGIAPRTAAESGFSQTRVQIHVNNHAESAMTGEGSALLESLLTPTLPVAGEEGFLSGLGSLIKTGIKYGAPIAGGLAKQYAPQIIGGIVKKVTGGSESAEAPGAGLLSEESTRFLFKRALLADASLTALQRLDKRQLGKLRLSQEVAAEHKLGDQEGAWGDFFKGVVQTVGPIALDGAKKAAASIAPKVMNAALSKLGLSESAAAAAVAAAAPAVPSHPGLTPAAGGPRTLKPRPSLLDMYGNVSSGSAVQVKV